MARFDTISFLTDYGLVDESVGVVKSVIRSIAPHVAVVDITHEIPPFDIRAGSTALLRSANYLSPGVVLAVVDPGVGTNRRAIAVEVGDGESVLVGPDNGLLAPVVNHVGGARRVVEITNTAFRLDSPGDTFAGRDVFAPAAAHLCNGVDLEALGPIIDEDDLVPAVIPFSAEKDGVLTGDILHVDRYGNAHTNVAPSQVEHFGATLRLSLQANALLLRLARTFADVAEGEPVLYTDEVGMLALALNQGSAAERFKLGSGDTFTLEPASS